MSREDDGMTKIHLDTDFGGDPDDACALAMLLGWPETELVGITTTIDPGGQRAAYVSHCLNLAGRNDIPVAAGAEVSLTTRQVAEPFLDDERFWPRTLARRPSRPGAALDLLQQNIDAGATIVAVGPYTNLALLEVMRPGTLGRVPVIIMGGWVHPPAPGLPAWGPEMDFNVQWDTRAAEIVATSAADLTLSTLPATLTAPLRAADLPQLQATGPLGALLARQSETYGQDQSMADLGRAHPGLPDDLVNFHWDPVACAVALGWPGATMEEMHLRPVLTDNVLRFQPDPEGRPMRIVVDVDGASFTEAWLTAVAATRP
ncbi:MAG: nucleoside hydrolase [Chloroflexia bacterium]|nr:nucleoside hydrolase [Chloroflexia bacterium]